MPTNRRVSDALGFSLLLALAGADSRAADNQPPVLLLEGHVVDPAGKPVAGARISGRVSYPGNPYSELEHWEITVDDSGYFELWRDRGKQEPLSATLIAGAPGYSSSLQQAAKIKGQPDYQPVVLALRPAVDVTVHVIDLAGKPVPAATVVCLPAGNTGSTQTRVDTSGSVTFRGLDDSVLPQFSATAPGYVGGGQVRVVPSQPTGNSSGKSSVEVQLLRGGTVRGRLLDRDTGAPIAGCRLSDTVTRADGSFWLRDRIYGDAPLLPSCLGYGHDYDHPNATDLVYPASLAGQTVEVRLRHDQLVTGKVIDDQGAPVAGARVVRRYVQLDLEGRPMHGVQVSEYKRRGRDEEFAQTDGLGEFRFANSSMDQFDLYVDDAHGREPTYLRYASLPESIVLHWHGAHLPSAGPIHPPWSPPPPPRITKEPVLIDLAVEDENGAPPPETFRIRVHTSNITNDIQRPALEGHLVLWRSDIREPFHELELELYVPRQGHSEKVRVAIDQAGRAHPDHVTLRLLPLKPFTLRVVGPAGEPVAGATVTDRSEFIAQKEAANWFRPVELKTDKTGSVAFSAIEPEKGDWPGPILEMKKEGLVTEVHGLTKEELNAGQLRVVMTAGATLRVVVRDEAGTPVEGVEVSDQRGNFTMKSDARGEVILEHLQPKLQVQLYASDGERWGRLNTAPASVQGVAVLKIAKSPVVHVIVTMIDWRSGAPIDRALLGYSKSTTLGPGRFAIEARPGEKLVLGAAGYEMSDHEIPVPETPGATLEARLELVPKPPDPGFTIHGHLSTAQGQPLPRTSVCYYPSPSGKWRDSELVVTTDESGDFTLDGVTREGIEFCHQPDERGRFYIPADELRPDQTIQLHVEPLPDKVQAGGTVTQPDGTPLASGHLELTQRGRRATVRWDFPRELSTGCSSVNTDSEGRFFIDLERGDLVLEGCGRTQFAPIAVDTRLAWPAPLQIDLVKPFRAPPDTRQLDIPRLPQLRQCELDDGP